jgi:hypothetical protein
MIPSDKIIEVLKSVSETDEVQRNLDLPLYDLQILDSLKTDLVTTLAAPVHCGSFRAFSSRYI